MNWKSHKAEIDRLKARYSGRGRTLPEPTTVSDPCTCGFGPTPKRAERPQIDGLIVDTLHKQGMMVLTKADLPYAGGRKP